MGRGGPTPTKTGGMKRGITEKMAPSHPSPNRGTKGRGARRPRFDPGSLPACSTGCRPIDEAGPCAEGTKIPSVVPGGRRAEGLHTQSVPGHKVEVMGLGCQAPRAASYVGAPCAAGGGRRRLGLQPKKKNSLRKTRCGAAC